jgi:hypothetical protein
MTKELAEKLISYGEKGVELASGQITELTQEFLNYLIFESVLGIIKGLAFIFIPLLVFKLLQTLKSHYTTEDNKNENMLALIGAGKGLCLVVTLIVILQVSFSDAKRIGKIVIAPKVFILEEGSKLLRGK